MPSARGWGALRLVGLAVVLLADLSSQAKVRSGEQRRTLWACATDIIVLCAGVEPGDGRMESCLRSKKGYLTSMCANKRRSSDRLPAACKRDSSIHCPGEGEDALQLMCLRRHRNRLSAECWQRLSKLQSDGWELLHSRFKMLGVDTPCAGALLTVCKDVAPGYGALRWCVESNWKKLEHDCGLAKREEPEVVAEVCEADALSLCKNVVKGDGRVGACLRYFEKDPTLSEDCRSAIKLEEAGLDTVCARDVTRFCLKGERSRHDLIECLHKHQEKLAFGCTTRKHKFRPEHLGSHFRNLHTGDHATDCAADIKKFCKGLKPGQGLIHQCLMENRESLSHGCKVPEGQVVRRVRTGPAGDQARRASSSQPDYVQSGAETLSASALSIMLDIELGAFEKSDTDGNGMLDVGELHKALELSYLHHETTLGTGPDAGKAPARPGASDIMRKADTDASGGLDIDEFHALFQHPEVDTQLGTNEGDDDADGPDRQFDERGESRLSRLLTNPWISTPLLAMVGFFVFSYRSSVRNSAKPRRRPGTSAQGVGLATTPSSARRRR